MFDSDIATKPDVQAAESQLAALLKSRGAVVKVVRMPEGEAGSDGKPVKVGLDDFLVACEARGLSLAREVRALLEGGGGTGPARRRLDEASGSLQSTPFPKRPVSCGRPCATDFPACGSGGGHGSIGVAVRIAKSRRPRSAASCSISLTAGSAS